MEAFLLQTNSGGNLEHQLSLKKWQLFKFLDFYNFSLYII